MTPSYSNPQDGQTLALLAIGWIVSDPARGERFLGLTGLDGEQLRERLNDPSVLGAALDFLAGHERDLVACADALDVTPERLAAVRGEMG